MRSPQRAPDAANGLRATSQIMLDKPMTVKVDKIGPAFGSLDDVVMISVSRFLACLLYTSPSPRDS